MRHCSFLLASCCLIAGQLYAQPVYTYASTSVYMQQSIGAPGTILIASGPGFSLSGSVGGQTLPPAFPVGQVIPLNISFQTNPEGAAVATADFGGIILPTGNVSGSVEAFSSSTFILPPNPAAAYTFPAHVTGQFTARPEICGPGEPFPVPPCDASAVLFIDMPGELTVHVAFFGPPSGLSEVYTTFESVPEPSSIGLWLLGAGTCGMVWLVRRRKARPLPW